MRLRLSLISLLVFAFATNGFARKHGQASFSNADNTPGHFDYYLLTLSWAPQFCASNQSNANSSECDPKRHYGLVVHGLWPQNDNGTFPENCAGAQPVSGDIVREMLPIMPARGLIQHEWSTHGTCSGLSTQDYFGEIQQAFRQIKVPADYQHPSQPFQAGPSEIEQKFADANGAPRNAFHTSCSGGEFVAIEICLTKDLHYRECGSSVRECHTPKVKVLPTL